MCPARTQREMHQRRPSGVIVPSVRPLACSSCETALANAGFAWQALCLRLAIIKCHARRPIDLDALQLQRDGDRARLVHAPGWAERNPRTLYLLQEEVLAWERSGPLRLRIEPRAS